jgi:hypothetical protein
MRRSPTLGVLAVAALLVASIAQGAGPVLKQIPAGSMGYLVVRNVQSTTTNVDRFLQGIGMGMMMPPGGVLQMIKQNANLGAGFDDTGGLAVVMLDPQQYGLDLVALMGPQSGPPPQPNQIPVVIFVPGSGVQEVFGPMAQPMPDGKHFRMGPMIATHKDGYVVASPCEPALKAALSPSATADSELTPESAALLEKADAGAQLNMKIVGPIYTAMLKKVQEQMAGVGPGGAAAMGPAAIMMQMQGMYSEIFDQLDALTIAARLTDSGVVIDEMVGFVAGSDLAKATLQAPHGDPKLDRVPDLPYVLGISSLGSAPGQAEMSREMTENILKGLGLGMDAKAQADLVASCMALNESVVGVQMVGGAAPAGNGLFGAALVVECRDASGVQAVKAAIGDMASLAALVAKKMPPGSGGADLSIAYAKGVEKSSAGPVDAVTVSHPELEKLAPEERAEMQKVLGEDKVCLRVTTVGDKSVVATFGGSTAFLDEAIGAAKSGGKSIKAPSAVAPYMPERKHDLMLFNVGNLMQVVVQGMQTMKPQMAAAIPFRITTKEPIVMSSGVSGSSAHVVFWVPTPLIREVAQVAMTFMMMQGGGPGGPPMGPGGGF